LNRSSPGGIPHVPHRLAVQPPRLKDLRQDAGVSCEEGNRERGDRGCQEESPGGEGGARTGRPGRRDLRHPREPGPPSRSEIRKAGSGDPAGAPHRPQRQPARAHAPRGEDPAGGIRRSDLQEGPLEIAWTAPWKAVPRGCGCAGPRTPAPDRTHAPPAAQKLRRALPAQRIYCGPMEPRRSGSRSSSPEAAQPLCASGT
jgi:hypothetical protein